MRARTLLVIWLGVLAPLGMTSTAAARTSDAYTYSFDQTWRAAVRLIAVDFRFPINDRDEDIGYILFQYQEGGRAHHGSLELVRSQDDNGTPVVRVVMQVNAMPSYVERHLLDRLRRKLTDEYGTPPPSRRPEPAPPAAPGEDEGEDEDAPTE
ncbi:MAG: hypothetical protein RLO52_43070 [Sandaracinaceae bacterium]|nr:hypothetical protein [Myxococcales bacterium]